MISSINNSINIALSGFNAATTQINVNANNIANVESSNYAPQQVVQSSQVNGGVSTNVAAVNPPSISVYDPNNTTANAGGVAQLPNVDPAQQLVQANIASYDAQANLSVIKVDDKNFQSILNIIS